MPHWFLGRWLVLSRSPREFFKGFWHNISLLIYNNTANWSQKTDVYHQMSKKSNVKILCLRRHNLIQSRAGETEETGAMIMSWWPDPSLGRSRDATQARRFTGRAVCSGSAISLKTNYGPCLYLVVLWVSSWDNIGDCDMVKCPRHWHDLATLPITSYTTHNISVPPVKH